MKSFDVVIFGGGFCGMTIAQILEKSMPGLRVALVDKSAHFEYTPSIHKIAFEKEYFDKITLPYKDLLPNTTFIQDTVLKVSHKGLKLKKQSLKFKYLVISPGIKYPIFLKNKENTFVLKTCKESEQIFTQLPAAKEVVVVGGGLVGTEIAGELVTKTKKKITIVHTRDRLIQRNPESASAYALEFLKKNGAKVIFGEHVVDHKGNYLYTDKKKKLRSDMTIWAAGVQVDSSWLSSDFEKVRNDRGALRVNEYLQLECCRNIFAGGDITNVKEEKTAQNAERHAYVIAHNIRSLEKGHGLKRHKPRTGPLIISLGDKVGILTVPGKLWTLNGRIPGLMKWMVEWWILFKARWKLNHVLRF